MPARPYVDRLKVIYTAAKGLRFPWLFRDFPRAVQFNGIGRYICQLQRLTISFCKTSEDSSGIRQFIQRDLLDFARLNPSIVVYVSPHLNKPPTLLGEYLNGRQASLLVTKMDRDEIGRQINYLRTRSGQKIVHFERESATTCPSIQGIWHPMMHQDSAMNLGLPQEKFSAFQTADLSASELLLKLADEENSPLNVTIVVDGTEQNISAM